MRLEEGALRALVLEDQTGDSAGRLAARAALKNKIANRLRPVELAQEEPLPAITYQLEGGPRTYSHDGPDGLAFLVYRFSVFDESLLEAVRVGGLLRQVLSGYQVTANGVRVDGIFLDDEEHGREDDERRLARADLLFRIIVAEDRP